MVSEGRNIKAPSAVSPYTMYLLEIDFRINVLAQNIKKNFTKYDFIIVSVISPLKKTRRYASQVFKENYFEIYVFASLKTLVKRDTKGLYELSRKGLIDNLIGFNSKIKYEKSNHQYLRINTAKLSLNQSLEKILKYTNVIT